MVRIGPDLIWTGLDLIQFRLKPEFKFRNHVFLNNSIALHRMIKASIRVLVFNRAKWNLEAWYQIWKGLALPNITLTGPLQHLATFNFCFNVFNIVRCLSVMHVHCVCVTQRYMGWWWERGSNNTTTRI